MIFSALFFYLFAIGVVGSTLMVISVKNPVHAVLLLLLAFLYGAGLFIMIDAELIAIMLIIVYVGAVGVLFLFVVMMLNIKHTERKARFLSYMPLCLLIVVALGFDLFLVFDHSLSLPVPLAHLQLPIDPLLDNKTKLIGNVLYTNYLLPFQLSGLILLVAMIGSIVLTLRVRPATKKQNIAKQLDRGKASGMEIVKVKSGEGISELKF
jgi:NADH-quinone oxidoreductase subunit J